MQTILGSGGAIGNELAKILPEYTQPIRLVSRNPKKINSSDELMAADLTKADETIKAVAGSDVVYLTVGLPYKLKIWQQSWPAVISNVIEACAQSGSKLVFFDNMYMYDGHLQNPITEEHPINPPSKKGKVREHISKAVLEAHREGKIQSLIARSADFYGPGVKNTSLLSQIVFEPLSRGKKAQWLGNPDKKHAFTYTPDAARATAILGNDPEAYGQVWHMPTASNPMSGRQIIEWVAGKMHGKTKIQVASKAMVGLMGLFMPIMRELKEMMYQYEQDYVFDSSKFNDHYKFKPVSYEEGLSEIIQQDYT